MNRKLIVLLIAVLVCLALPAGAGAVHAAADWTQVPDTEPNNTSGTAVQAAYGSQFDGTVSTTDTVDFYKFSGAAGDKIALPDGWFSNSTLQVTLLNPSGTAVVLSGVSRTATLPVSGAYRLRVTRTDLLDYEQGYDFLLVKLTGSEPNDSMATAVSVQPTQTVQGVFDYPCDNDWYVFQGRAGDVFPIIYSTPQFWDEPPYYVFDAGGNRMDGINVLPADGTYYLEMLGSWSDGHDFACLEGDYTVTFGYPMWVSADVDGLGGNTAIKQQDIAMRANAAGKWQLVFDASDVGITQDLVGMERLDDGSILMSLAASQTLPGLGKVMPQDIIRFIPSSLGPTTTGTFEWYLDGSDVGLTTTGEKIDAIFIRGSDDQLVISLAGGGSVPRQSGGTLTVADEDLINFVPVSLGANSAGKWRYALDGSTVPGMAVEDVNSAAALNLWGPSRFDRTMISFTDSFNVNGVSGGPKDVVFSDGGLVVKNLTNIKLDALSVGVALP